MSAAQIIFVSKSRIYDIFISKKQSAAECPTCHSTESIGQYCRNCGRLWPDIGFFEKRIKNTLGNENPYQFSVEEKNYKSLRRFLKKRGIKCKYYSSYDQFVPNKVWKRVQNLPVVLSDGDLLGKICNFLPIEEVFRNVISTCRKWREIFSVAKNNSLEFEEALEKDEVRRILMTDKEYGLRMKNVMYFTDKNNMYGDMRWAQYTPNIKYLYLRISGTELCSFIYLFKGTSLSNVRISIEALTVPRIHDMLAQLLKPQTRLRRLHLENYTRKFIETELVECCPNLRTLEITGLIYAMRASTFNSMMKLPFLQELTIKNMAFSVDFETERLDKSKSIKTLTISDQLVMDPDDYAIYEKLQKSCSVLKELRIENCLIEGKEIIRFLRRFNVDTLFLDVSTTEMREDLEHIVDIIRQWELAGTAMNIQEVLERMLKMNVRKLNLWIHDT